MVAGGRRVVLEWARGRLFDKSVAMFYQKTVQDARHVTVATVSEVRGDWGGTT